LLFTFNFKAQYSLIVLNLPLNHINGRVTKVGRDGRHPQASVLPYSAVLERIIWKLAISHVLVFRNSAFMVMATFCRHLMRMTLWSTSSLVLRCSQWWLRCRPSVLC